ncbi:lysophospholipid acyltransferase family protein [Peptostreptococcaceae bacterium AGR-M142]
MFKAINLIVSMFIYLIGINSVLKKSQKLKTEGKFEQRDELLLNEASKWADMVLNKAGVNLIVKGRENLVDEPCLFVCNHQSNFDIPILVKSLDRMAGFIAKKELAKIPVLSKWIIEVGSILIDRNNPREALKGIKEGINSLKEGKSLVIFPEGTRSKNGEVLEFKAGSMKLAIKAGVKIIPVSINGSTNIMKSGTFKINSGDVFVNILKPIDVNDFSKDEQKTMSSYVENLIREDINSQKK